MSTRPSSRGPSGQWEVEAAELHRVYPLPRPQRGAPVRRGEARRRLWREQAQRLALAATAARRSWWQRLKGG